MNTPIDSKSAPWSSIQLLWISWSRARGAFAGVSLQGALRKDEDDNADIYEHELTNKQAINGPTVWPNEGSELCSLLNKYVAGAAQRRVHKHNKEWRTF